ncbi:cysteine desulfurase family protein [Salinicoccus roseus]|uniref:cysteine desulfurase family protein n=1 Tax=Salinicoccus roseus TaxID=45670 RepID=UPI001E3644DC|nr:cysteine desulfurase family protein [Salinicoccus roseus]
MDNAATTRPYDDVLETYMNVNKMYYANTSSIHQAGREAAKLLEASRRQILDLMGLEGYDCIFTSGATESNNIAIQSVLRHKKPFGRTVLLSELEHPSVINVGEVMKDEGFNVRYIRTLPDGTVDMAHLGELLDDDVVFVTVMAVNNIVGTIQPIREMIGMLKAYPKVHFHVDATQAVGKMRMDYRGVDSLSISAHKFHGVKGIGALIAREAETLSAIAYGGGHERNIRSGTVNLPGAVSMARALRNSDETLDAAEKRVYAYNRKVKEAVSGLHAVQVQPGGVPHIMNLSFTGAKGEVVVNALGTHDIFVSTTSACASKLKKLNETLLAMGSDQPVIEGSIRISFSSQTEEAEVDRLITALYAVHTEIGDVLK